MTIPTVYIKGTKKQANDKRDYPKIDIYVNCTYRCSTNWAKTCKEAVQRFIAKGEAMPQGAKVTACFAKD